MVPGPALNALIQLLVKLYCCSEAEHKMLTESGDRTWMVEILLAKVECKEIDTNHWQKWVSTDFSSPNVDAISSSKYEFASRVEGTWQTHLTPTEDMWKWQTSISDQQESSWICKMRSDQSDNKYPAKFLTNNTLCTLSYEQLCIFFVCMEPTWTRMNSANTMRIFQKYYSNILCLTILGCHYLFTFLPNENC